MHIRKSREARQRRRLSRNAMKQGIVIRRPAHLGRILVILALTVGVIVAALFVGSSLKKASEAHRQEQEQGNWTVEEETNLSVPGIVPNIRAISISPEGNVGDILIAGDHGGIILPLQDGAGTLLYDSDVARAAGLSVSTAPVDLAADVARVQKRGLNVTCVLTLTFSRETDSALRAYKRGLELALLYEYAEAGMDDLLLFGLPNGNDGDDRLSMDFLRDLRSMLGGLDDPPAIGVALPPEVFAQGETSADSDPIYAGSLTPSRIRTACDYLALDLRDRSAEQVAAILPHIRYAYTRHALRILVNKSDEVAVEDILSHGFTRVFEMDGVRVDNGEGEN